MNDNEYMAIAKEFTLAIGGEWHEWLKPVKNTKHTSAWDFYCSCSGYVYTSHHSDTPFCKGHNESDNPTWNNPADIANAIKAVKCGRCEGEGEIKTCHSMRCPTVGKLVNGNCIEPKSNCLHRSETTCPTCSGTGTINLWDEFKDWIYKNYFEFAEDSYDILVNPKLLMQSYISFARGRE